MTEHGRRALSNTMLVSGLDTCGSGSVLSVSYSIKSTLDLGEDGVFQGKRTGGSVLFRSIKESTL